MKNEIMIKKENVDWLKIIRLALKKKDWGKKYVLYHIRDTVLSCVMTTFNFEEDKATFRLTLEYSNKIAWGNYEDIDYYLKNFSIADFKMHLDKKIKKLIDWCLKIEKEHVAEEKYIDLKISSYKLFDEDYIESKPDEFDKLNSLVESELKNELLNTLKEKIVEELNEPYNKAVQNWVLTNSLEFDGFKEILGDLK